MHFSFLSAEEIKAILEQFHLVVGLFFVHVDVAHFDAFRVESNLGLRQFRDRNVGEGPVLEQIV